MSCVCQTFLSFFFFLLVCSVHTPVSLFLPLHEFSFSYSFKNKRNNIGTLRRREREEGRREQKKRTAQVDKEKEREKGLMKKHCLRPLMSASGPHVRSLSLIFLFFIELKHTITTAVAATVSRLPFTPLQFLTIFLSLFFFDVNRNQPNNVSFPVIRI